MTGLMQYRVKLAKGEPSHSPSPVGRAGVGTKTLEETSFRNMVDFYQDELVGMLNGAEAAEVFRTAASRRVVSKHGLLNQVIRCTVAQRGRHGAARPRLTVSPRAVVVLSELGRI